MRQIDGSVRAELKGQLIAIARLQDEPVQVASSTAIVHLHVLEGDNAGEWPGGIAPPGSLRTGRDSLPSSGPHRPA